MSEAEMGAVGGVLAVRMTENVAPALRMGCSDEALFELMNRWSEAREDARALRVHPAVIRAMSEVISAAEAEARLRGLTWLATT